MTADGLEVRQSSASVWNSKTELRNLRVVSKLIDTSTCIGCKACEVACQEWNDLHIVPTEQRGTYQTMPTLHANYWNLIQFREREIGPDFAWLLRKDGCMHCADPGCLKACPAPGAIVLNQNGFVNAALYDPPGVGGTTVITVLAHGDHPEWYGLPKDPHVPTGVRFWKNALRPLGALAIAGAFFAMVGHYLSFGPKKPKDTKDTQQGEESK